MAQQSASETRLCAAFTVPADRQNAASKSDLSINSDRGQITHHLLGSGVAASSIEAVKNFTEVDRVRHTLAIRLNQSSFNTSEPDSPST